MEALSAVAALTQLFSPLREGGSPPSQPVSCRMSTGMVETQHSFSYVRQTDFYKGYFVY